MRICLQLLSYSFFKSFFTSYRHLFFCHPLGFIPIGFKSLIFLTCLISSILLTFPYYIILCAFIYQYLLLLQISAIPLSLILYSSLDLISPHIFLIICLPKSNTLFMSRPDNVPVHKPGITNITLTLLLVTKKFKAIPLQGWTGPEGSRRFRLPDFKTIGT